MDIYGLQARQLSLVVQAAELEVVRQSTVQLGLQALELAQW